MYQTPFADKIRNEIGLATMAVGNITSADQVNTIVVSGRADLVALARAHSRRSLLHAARRGVVPALRPVLAQALSAGTGPGVPARGSRPGRMDCGTPGDEAAQPRSEGRKREGRTRREKRRGPGKKAA